MFYLTTLSTHFIYGYMASDIWLRTIQIVRKETRCRHIDYSYRLTARILLYPPSHRQDNTYHGLCYTKIHRREERKTHKKYYITFCTSSLFILQKLTLNSHRGNCLFIYYYYKKISCQINDACLMYDTYYQLAGLEHSLFEYNYHI